MKTAKFFCESCGAEVPGNSKFCKKCGRFFSSVRCPVCGETGPNEKFTNGCPKCGYTVKGGADGAREKTRVSRAARRRFLSAIDSKSPRADGSLPAWAYCAITFAFVAVAAAFVYVNR